MQCTKLQLFDIKQNDRTFKLLQFFTRNLLVLLHENCKIVNMYIEISRYVYRLQVPYTRQQGHVKYMYLTVLQNHSNKSLDFGELSQTANVT